MKTLPKTTDARPGCLSRFVRLLRRAVNALQCTIPVSRSRKLALGFFTFDGPQEWGLKCITFDGPNYYLAAGNLGFGWGLIDYPPI